MNSQNPKYPQNTSCVCRVNGENRGGSSKTKKKVKGSRKNQNHGRSLSIIQFAHLFGFVNCKVLPREALRRKFPGRRAYLRPPAPEPQQRNSSDEEEEEEEEVEMPIIYYMILTSLQIWELRSGRIQKDELWSSVSHFQCSMVVYEKVQERSPAGPYPPIDPITFAQVWPMYVEDWKRRKAAT